MPSTLTPAIRATPAIPATPVLGSLLLARTGTPALLRHWQPRFGLERGVRVLGLLAGIWTLNAFDLGLTCLALSQRLSEELNPLADALAGRSPAALCAYKALLVVGGSVGLLRHRRRMLVEVLVAAVAVVYVVLALRWAQLLALYHETLCASPEGFDLALIWE